MWWYEGFYVNRYSCVSFYWQKNKTHAQGTFRVFEWYGNCKNTHKNTNTCTVSYKRDSNLPIIAVMRYTICVNISLHLRSEKEWTQMCVILERRKAQSLDYKPYKSFKVPKSSNQTFKSKCYLRPAFIQQPVRCVTKKNWEIRWIKPNSKHEQRSDKKRD